MYRELRTALWVANVSAAAMLTGCASTSLSDPREMEDADVKQLLVLMDKDKSGTVSKQEFMQFMEAEFDRLDVNRDGVLDVKELTQLHVKGLGISHK